MTKVLIVEDDPLISRMYLRVFKYKGFEVELAENGQAGLEKLKVFRPDIILADIMMPLMNGVEMLAKLKADPATKDIPIVMLSNLSDTTTAEDTLKQGAVQYIVKSSHGPDEVAALAQEVIDTQKKASENEG